MSATYGAMRSRSGLASFIAKFREFCRLIGVVLLQDMRTRYGASYLGYFIAILWPLTHLAILSIGYVLRVQIAPIGDSPAMFIVTGVIPYILCLYPARIMQLAIVQNRQLLHIPLIQPLHLIICRCILEMLNGMVIMFIVLFTMYLFDIDVMPLDLSEAAKAFGAAVALGVGLGFLNVVIFALVGMPWSIVFIGIMISLYLTSGVYVPTWAVPEPYRFYLYYNPLLNVVEWLRSAYFLSYDTSAIKKTLIIGVAATCLTLGLIGERFLRGKFFS